MSRQIQIRRGSATEHQNFTGAVGEITMDTTNNTLRVHDGETAGGTMLARKSELPPASADYVIETQTPTAENNYTWYRKYQSGWVEQGGIWRNWNPVNAGAGKNTVITLPVTMSDKNYAAHVSLNSIGPSYAGLSLAVTQYTSGSIALNVWNFQVAGNYTDTGIISWSVSGYAA